MSPPDRPTAPKGPDGSAEHEASPINTAVPSPCINVCRMDAAAGWCAGCLRTLDEIAAWSRMDEGDKRVVWVQLRQRRQLVRARAAGLAAPPAGTVP